MTNRARKYKIKHLIQTLIILLLHLYMTCNDKIIQYVGCARTYFI
jgi:hypothetical protein